MTSGKGLGVAIDAEVDDGGEPEGLLVGVL